MAFVNVVGQRRSGLQVSWLARSPSRPTRRPPPAARAAAAPVEQQQPTPLTTSTILSDKVLITELRQRASGAAGTSGRVVLEKPEELRSTLEHRAWVASTSVLLAATLATGLGKVESIGDAAVACGAVLTAYVVADLVRLVGGGEGLTRRRMLALSPTKSLQLSPFHV